MTRSTMLSALACGLILINVCDAAEFKEFTSAAGGFKVQMPGTPTEETQEAKEAKIVMYSAETDDAYFVAGYTDMPFPAELVAKHVEKTLDGSRRGMLEQINGKLLKETKITLDDKHSGRDLRAEVKLPGKTGIVRARIYLVDRRLIQLVTVGTEEAVDSPDVDKFFKSFALTK